ncbi:MAG: glycosyltransferase [Candidatus Levyibacteriota bacterium]|jgi:glycosyltransferase involved in cell wall biosynthesis
MKVSVIIPVYNEEKFIARCLEALQDQTEKADEIIIVDNNSKDKTVKIAQRFPVKIISERKQGLTFARNLGFDTAYGDIIARIDADTEVPPNWIKKLKKHFRNNPNLIALSGPTSFEDAKFNHLLIVEKALITSWKTIFGHDILYGSNMALTKKAWRKVKNYICLDDKLVHEDLDLAIHLGELKTGRILFDKKFIAQVSERRWKKAESYLEYPYRYLKTLATHNKYFKLPA